MKATHFQTRRIANAATVLGGSSLKSYTADIVRVKFDINYRGDNPHISMEHILIDIDIDRYILNHDIFF